MASLERPALKAIGFLYLRTVDERRLEGGHRAFADTEREQPFVVNESLEDGKERIEGLA